MLSEMRERKKERKTPKANSQWKNENESCLRWDVHVHVIIKLY